MNLDRGRGEQRDEAHESERGSGGHRCCLRARSAPLATSAPASAASTPFGITTTPALSPAFSAGTTDYVVPCAGHPTTRVVTTGAGSIVGGKSFPGRADVQARLVPGQSLHITAAGHSYFVRCLPSDFPKYSATVNGTPQTNGLLVTPAASLSGPSGHYVAAFDAKGVPVWWYRDPNTPADAKFFGPSTIGWASGNKFATAGTFSLRGLNGAVKHTVGTAQMTLDGHDLQRLPGGKYLAILEVSRPGVDLSSWGLSSQSTITDDEIVELNAANKVVWSWSVAAHINVATANLNWRNQFPDVVHMNSIQLLGNHELVFSTAALRCRVRDRHQQRRHHLEAGRHDDRAEPHRDARPVRGDATRRRCSPGSTTRGSCPTGRSPCRTTAQCRCARCERCDSRSTPPHEPRPRSPRSPTAASARRSAAAASTTSRPATGSRPGARLEFATELTPSGNPVLTVSYAPYFSYRVAPVVPPISALRAGMDGRVAPLKL